MNPSIVSPSERTGTGGAGSGRRRGRLPSALVPEESAQSSFATALLFPYREDAELGEQAVRDRAALPTTLEGFKKHPLYVLQRHIPRYSALAPDTKSVGLHR